jgi:methyl-accepting chemotaxis protein-1 (serine sensor receptor)
MDEVTQQNAALVEQAAAASGSLEEQAEGLRKAVSVFKINAPDVIDVPAHHVDKRPAPPAEAIAGGRRGKAARESALALGGVAARNAEDQNWGTF